MVNNQGNVSKPGADADFVETKSINNVAEAAGFKRYAVSIVPADTTLGRATSVQVITIAKGGTLQSGRWVANSFLSCSDCLNPVETPNYTERYYVTVQN